jgi:hypothetical protein
MARAPRAKVSKTSGAGVSRRSYQQGYAKGNRGTAAAGGAVPGVDKPTQDEAKSMRGGKAKFEKGGGEFNVSYGSTLPIGDLEDVKGYAKGKPAQHGLFKQGKGLNLVDKGRSAYAKK